LERGLTYDHAFEEWANLVWKLGANPESALVSLRKDIIIDVFNEAGQKIFSYKVFRCWVSEYQALPDLDANANAVAIEHIKLENEGWECDTSITEPQEPTTACP
jgi:phage tail-like protein